ncbi:aldose 1-epimerase family protein [Hansschlegelia quercus]|uniref:Aldose 1-epimerase family protein n=1 Tax=Hansschlegelia quercus TaxID=2528245 RepID=A0A4Q9GI66_9HYPH|nr:aldose 1-epimerase family protein [Hansschlegelia quercus]TBN53708.1 aldose 1-epimerase family protein [Hansschlegelia quercus]
MPETHRIASSAVSVVIAAKGAEPVSLKDAAGTELLWQAGPEWPRHAPVLFPIVGRLAGDTLRSGGEAYRLTQHGFARDAQFEWLERSSDRARLAFSDDKTTRDKYPFAFRLELDYRVEGASFAATARVTNPSADAVLPFSIGAHPGFRWPLVEGVPKEAHVLEFAAQETGPSRSVIGGLLGPEQPLPFGGRTMTLMPELFANDAVVMPSLSSRSVRYVAVAPEGGIARALTISWRGYDDLGVWSPPSGAPFLCIEPWRGMASPQGWDGAFIDKPGVSRLKPGATATFEWRVEV